MPQETNSPRPRTAAPGPQRVGHTPARVTPAPPPPAPRPSTSSTSVGTRKRFPPRAPQGAANGGSPLKPGKQPPARLPAREKLGLGGGALQARGGCLGAPFPPAPRSAGAPGTNGARRRRRLWRQKPGGPSASPGTVGGSGRPAQPRRWRGCPGRCGNRCPPGRPGWARGEAVGDQ